MLKPRRSLASTESRILTDEIMTRNSSKMLRVDSSTPDKVELIAVKPAESSFISMN